MNLLVGHNMIVGFDLKDEEFGDVPFSHDMRKDKLSLIKLVGGSLCIINICQNNNEVRRHMVVDVEGRRKQQQKQQIVLSD